MRKRGEEGQGQRLTEMGRQRKKQCPIKKKDTQRMARHWAWSPGEKAAEVERGQAEGSLRSEHGPKKVDMHLGACEVTLPSTGGEGKQCRAGLGAAPRQYRGLPQPALPRSFCCRGHQRREERKEVGGEGHRSTSPVLTLCTRVGQTVCKPCIYLYVTFFPGLCSCLPGDHRCPQYFPPGA